MLRSDEMFEIIDQSKAPNTTPMEGACWIVADALSMAINAPVYCIYNEALNHIDHFMVKTGRGVYLDGLGFQSEQQILKENLSHYEMIYAGDWVKKGEDGEKAYVTLDKLHAVEFAPKMKSLAKDIIQDLDASRQIAELLKNAMR